MAIERLPQPAIETMATLAPPEQVPDAQLDAWARIAPPGRQLLDTTLNAACEALQGEAQTAATPARRRLADQAVAALQTRRPGLEERMRAQLALLLTDPTTLQERWPHCSGAFALHQLAERLRSGHVPRLATLARLLGWTGPEPQGAGLANALVGLLHQTMAMDTLPPHARHVLCTQFARQLDVLFEATGPHDALQAAPARPTVLPRALSALLTRVQLQMLDEEQVAPETSEALFEAELTASAAPQDAEMLDAVRDALSEGRRLVERISEPHGLDESLNRELRRLVPVLAKTRLLTGRPAETLPAVRAFLALVLELGLDAPSERCGDTLPELLEELIGDLLSQFNDDAELWMVCTEDARLRISERQRGAEGLRHRAVQRLAGRQRLATARRAARPLVEALAQRHGTEAFLQSWQDALTQGFLRADAQDNDGTQLRQLTAALIMREGSALTALRPALEQALGWICTDPGEIALLLDQLFALLGPPPRAPEQRGSLQLLLRQRIEGGRVTLFSGPAHRWPVRLADGRRRYLLGVRRAGDDGQVIVSDRTGHLIELEPAPVLQRDLKRGAAVRLDPQRLLAMALEPGSTSTS